jgi:four helix bundle protein
MGRPSVEDLEIYHLAEKLGDEVWRVVSRWQRLAQTTIGAQMIRAADGVGTNIAQGAGRTTYRDDRRFRGMARGSLYETTQWLRRAFARDLLKQEEIARLKVVTAELAPRLNAYLKAMSQRCSRQGRAPSLKDEMPRGCCCSN